MGLTQKKFREIVLQILFSANLTKKIDEATVPFMMKELKTTRSNILLAIKRVEFISENLDVIDKKIKEVSISYEFERIQKVELSILRLGAYEILFDKEVPSKVAIAEAIRLTRKFSTKEAANFVNALLDNLYKKENGEETDLKVLEKSAAELGSSEKKSETQANKNSSSECLPGNEIDL